MSFSIIPFGGVVDLRRTRRRCSSTDLPVAVLLRAGDGLDRRVRHRARRLVVDVAVPAARRAALRAQVISYEIAMGLSFVAVFLFAGSLSTSEIVAAQAHGSRYWSVSHPVLVRVLLLPSFVVYLDHDGGRVQPHPVRPARGRGRAGRRLPHRVLLAEVRDVLPRRVHQHDDAVGAGDHAVPRRLARPVADLRCGRTPTPAGGRSCGSWSSCWLFIFFFIWLRGTLPRCATTS